MTERWTLERVLELVEGDRELVEQLWEIGVCERSAEGFSAREVELVRVAHVLVRELDVNWPGVEIILRLRSELIDTRRQIAELLELVQKARGPGAEGD